MEGSYDMTNQTSSAAKGKWGMYLLAIVLIAMSSASGVLLYRSSYEASASRRWPTVEGRVIKSEWIQHRGKGCPYTINFSYGYKVGLQPLIGNTFRFGGECYYAEVSYITSNYPVGSEVVVHYDPNNPGNSVIVPGSMSPNASLGLYLCPIAIILGIVLIVRVYFVERQLPRETGASWPTFQATVAKAAVQSYGDRYRAEISYSYQVNGEYYSGYYEGDWTRSEGEADAVVEEYPEKKILQVHVHPDKPELSVLSL